MFFNDYSKPGRGVKKRDPNQPRIQVFMDVMPRKLWDLIKLNMLYLLTAIPLFSVTMVIVGIVSSTITDLIVVVFGDAAMVSFDVIMRIILAFWFMIILGLGPVTAGYTYIIREYSREHYCWIISDFFERFKSNFKQGILLWIIDLAVFFLLVVAFKFYMNRGIFILQYIILLAGVMYAMIHIYIYQMMVTFDLSLKSLFRNSLIMSIAKAPASLIILLSNIIIYAIIPIAVLMTAKSNIIILIMLLTEVLILPPVTSFAINFYLDPILDKHINVENKTEQA